jgi:hypothetical protein
MTDDPLSELLSSPLDEMTPGHSRRAWLGFGVALLAAALAGTGIALWLTRGPGEGATTTTAGAAGPTTTAAGTGASTTTSASEDPTTTTTAAPVAGTPEPRVLAQLVATDAGLFLFGGLEPVQRLNADRFDDVWRYDPATGEWWDVQAPQGPVPRAGAAVAYDAGSGLVVLFGGAIGSCPYPACSDHIDDTWVYDPVANTWEERSPAASPPGRHGHTMAYDAQSDRVVLFGGDTGSAWLGDTWAYDAEGDTWVEVTTEEAPWPVAQQAMAYDPVADRIVLWGGVEREESVAWTLDLESATWSSVTWAPAPEPAWDACLVWDAAAEQMLLIGGEGLTTVQISEAITSRQVLRRDEVWALDLGAGAWALLGRLPGPVARHGCADDPDATGVFIWNHSALLPVDPATGEGMAEE